MFTRSKINSIGFGPPVLALIGALTLVLPAALYLGYSVVGFLGVKLDKILSLLAALLRAGVVLLALR